MEAVFLKILNMGFTASFLILAVVIFRAVLKKAPKWFSCLLWGLVAFKLLCPVSIESALSLVPSSEPLPRNIITGNTFQVNTGIGVVDTPVNEYLGAHYYEGVTAAAGGGNRVMAVLGWIWLTGVVLLLLYSLFSYYRLYKVTRVSVRMEENIFLCDNVDTPFILGIVNPRIYLPSYMAETQFDNQYVIAHERAHLKRHDHWWKPLGFLILTIYWFQPLCWLSYILFCRDIELACDERVIRGLGAEGKKPYAEALLSCSVKQSVVAACPLAFGEVGVKERIKNVLHYKKPALWVMLAAVICCIVAAVCFLTSPGEDGEETAFTEDLLSAVREKERLEGTDSGMNSGENGDGRDLEAEGESAVYAMLMRWQMAFCARDAEAIADMVSPELAERMLMGSEGNYSFGVSSPWPRDAEAGSYIYDYDGEQAVIYYYAMTSDPHVTAWKETLEYAKEDDTYVITAEELVSYDNISTSAEFEDAYHGYLDGTMMDYTRNGLGEALNQNALLSSSTVYLDLFEPERAAVFLLNLSDNPEEVQIALHEPEGSGLVGVDILFLEDRTSHTISMYQPYGENGIWVPVDYRVDVIARFMNVPWNEVKNIRFSGNITDIDSILCIGEIPEEGIKVYGYNDEEVGFQGVAIEIGEDVNYFDWFYTSPVGILPQLYWDESRRQLQVSCHIYTGTGAAADELHVLKQYDTGTLQESRLDINGYRALLEERVGYSFDENTRELVLTDMQTGEELAAVTVAEELGETVTGLEMGNISGFELGERIYFHVEPGYYVDDFIGIAEYEGMPELTFELVMTETDSGEIRFELGE